MSKKNGQKRTRITFQVDPSEADALKEMQAAGLGTKSVLLRMALDLLQVHVQRAREQDNVYVGPSREDASEVLIPALQRIKAKAAKSSAKP